MEPASCPCGCMEAPDVTHEGGVYKMTCPRCGRRSISADRSRLVEAWNHGIALWLDMRSEIEQRMGVD